jgi:hypothetical protein
MQNGMVNTEKQMSSMRNMASSSNTNYVTKVVLIIKLVFFGAEQILL